MTLTCNRIRFPEIPGALGKKLVLPKGKKPAILGTNSALPIKKESSMVSTESKNRIKFETSKCTHPEYEAVDYCAPLFP